MFKKQLLLAGLLCWTVIASAQNNPFYYELISNDSKTINFVFGLYPSTYEYIEGKEVDPYTSIKGAIINNAKDNDLKWNDYKISILLKSGKLIRSYSTVAKDGNYSCNYTVTGGATHYQYFCFHTKFNTDDIDKAWLTMTDDQIFGLLYDKNDK